MGVDLAFLLALAGMAAASFACRVAGFLLMGYVRITPRVEAAMRATPLAVMVGIATPAAASGRVPEMTALAVVALTVKVTGSDVTAALAGAATVAVCRWVGF